MSIRGAVKRFLWMLKVKDCHSICLFCGCIIRDIARFTKDEEMRKVLEKNLMPIPNNSIFKNGKIKEGGQK